MCGVRNLPRSKNGFHNDYCQTGLEFNGVGGGGGPSNIKSMNEVHPKRRKFIAGKGGM